MAAGASQPAGPLSGPDSHRRACHPLAIGPSPPCSCPCWPPTLSPCQPARPGGSLVVATKSRIDSLDPAQASRIGQMQVLSGLGDPLYAISAEGRIEPRLATALPILSRDGLKARIPLRQGVLFHDGTPFDAAAMVFSLQRFMAIGTLSYQLADRVEAVLASGPHVIELTLKRPFSPLPRLLSAIFLTPVSPTAYRQHKDKPLADCFVGTGPYRLAFFSGQQQRLAPWARYWGRRPANAGIDLVTLSNSTALFGALRSGEVDVLLNSGLEIDHQQALHRQAAAGRLRETVGPAFEIGLLSLLSDQPPLNRPALRQAVARSLDRATISQRVSLGLHAPLRQLVPPSLPGSEPNSWPAYDPAARASPGGDRRSLRQRHGHIGALRIHIHALQLGPYHQIHVLHRNRPDQHFIGQHHRAGEAAAVAEPDLLGTHIGHTESPAIGQHHLPPFEFNKLQLNHQMGGQAEVHSAGVHQGIALHPVEIWLHGVREVEVSAHESHDLPQGGCPEPAFWFSRPGSCVPWQLFPAAPRHAQPGRHFPRVSDFQQSQSLRNSTGGPGGERRWPMATPIPLPHKAVLLEAQSRSGAPMVVQPGLQIHRRGEPQQRLRQLLQLSRAQAADCGVLARPSRSRNGAATA